MYVAAAVFLCATQHLYHLEHENGQLIATPRCDAVARG